MRGGEQGFDGPGKTGKIGATGTEEAKCFEMKDKAGRD